MSIRCSAKALILDEGRLLLNKFVVILFAKMCN